MTVYKQSKKYEQGRTCCYAGSEKKLLRTAVKSMQSFSDFSVSVIKAKQNVCRVSMRFQCILERRYLSVLQNVCKENAISTTIAVFWQRSVRGKDGIRKEAIVCGIPQV